MPNRAWAAGSRPPPGSVADRCTPAATSPRARPPAAATPHRPHPPRPLPRAGTQRPGSAGRRPPPGRPGCASHRAHRKPLALLGCRDRPGRDLPAGRHRRRRREDQHDRRRRRRGRAVPDRSPHRARAAGADQRDGPGADLVPDDAFITRPMDDGEPVSNEEIPLRMLRWLAEQTGFLSNDQGWEASGRWRPGTGSAATSAPSGWSSNRTCGSGTGAPTPPPRSSNLPDADTDPVACWRELARRLERLSELLGIPWSTSPGSTGESSVLADPMGPGTGHETPPRTRRARRAEGRPDAHRGRAAAGRPARPRAAAPGVGVPVPPGDRQDRTVQGHRAADLRPAGQLPVLRRWHRPRLRPREHLDQEAADRRRDRRQEHRR